MRYLTIAVLLFLPCAVHGQTPSRALPERPKAKIVEHVALTGLAVTAGMLDSAATRWNVSRGGTEYDPLERPFAHSNALYAEGAAYEGGLAWVGWKLHGSNHPLLRHIWWLPQTAQTAASFYCWRASVARQHR
jgi:hypothetical protein